MRLFLLASGELFEAGFVVETRLLSVRHRSGLHRQFRDDGFHKGSASRAGGGELGFQLVHQGHQLIHFGHNPALFGEGREWSRELAHFAEIKAGLRVLANSAPDLRLP